MNTLSNVLKLSGHEIFENIGRVVLVNVLWFVLLSPAIFVLSWQTAILYLLFTLFPSLTAVFFVMESIVNHKKFSFRLFWQGFVRFYLRSLLLGLLVGVLTLILVASWWYYARVRTEWSLVIGIAQSYLVIMIYASQLYTIPLLVSDEYGLGACIAQSVRLFLDNAFYSMLAFLQLLTVGALLAVTVISFPLLYGGMSAIFLLNVFNNVQKKYKKTEDSVG